MWYDLRRHRSRARTHRAFALALGASALGLTPFGLLALAVGVTMLVTDNHPSVAVLTVIVGVSCCVLGGLAVWRAKVRWERWGRLDAVAAELTRVPGMPPADLQTALGWPRDELCEILLDAACWGLVADLPSPLFEKSAMRSAPGVGDVLDGRFRLQALLGEGGMGQVFRAVDVFSGRAVAVKTPRGAAADRERLEREAQLLVQIEHLNVQRVRFVGRTGDGSPYLVTDLLDGEALDRRLERVGTLPWTDALHIARCIAAALEATHGAGLLHRDLKPANIFLERVPDGETRPVLIDFGLARVLAGPSVLTRSGEAVGTPLYMSPEQARGEPLDARSDVHALAQLVFEMVTGTPPHFDVTEARMYERLLNEECAPMSRHAQVPPEVDRVVARGLARDRERRYPHARAFADALASVATTEEQRDVA